MTNTLQQELDALDSFIGLLQREQVALVNADTQTLLDLADAKLKLSDQLNALARARANHANQAGFAADANGIQGWLATQPPALSLLWERLLDKARAAQLLNQMNGQLIQTHLQHNQQALNALMSASNQAGIYGADGQPRMGAGSSTRSIDKV